MEPFEIRAHHGMCLAFFRGKGYGEEFTLHMGAVKEKLESNVPVRLITGTDVICGSCPHNKNGQCESEDKTEGYDSHVLRLCGLSPGCVTDYLTFYGLVRERVLKAGEREAICGDCQWNEICKGISC